jgi:hypothetical protein
MTLRVVWVSGVCGAVTRVPGSPECMFLRHKRLDRAACQVFYGARARGQATIAGKSGGIAKGVALAMCAHFYLDHLA